MIEVPKRALDALVMLHGIRLSRGVGRVFGVKKSLLAFEIQLTRELGLFDREHYLAQVPIEQLGTMSPLKHYVLIGDDLGLSPSPLFDTHHYDTRFRERYGINRLLHYGLVARFKNVSPTPWFDADYYLQSNPDVSASRLDALVHFQRWGWREGRSPMPGLDMRQLLSVRPELRVSKGSPLALFSDGRLGQAIRDQLHGQAPRHGALKARRAKSIDESLSYDLRDLARWADVQPRRYAQAPRVDVIIPVYSGVEETLRCLYTVLTAPVETPHQVLVINDAGPAPELNALIRALAARGLFELEIHRQNQGFVRTVNHGLRQHKDRDVVILNADTEVYGDWLDRMMRHADEFPRVATITPLSNNATICSYPETLNDNRNALELTGAETDALIAETNPGAHVEAPTGVGFCMYIRRTALRDVGWLDDRRFGRGYGEENDLCQRLIRRGWTNVIACDIYVKHVGSVSFRSEAAERTAKAMKTLAKLYPDYEAQVSRYIDADPAWQYRARVDLARLQRQCGEQNVLLVCHNRGGGTERHLLEQAQALMNEGQGVFELRPSKRARCVSLMHPGLYGLHNVSVLPAREDVLVEALQTLRITAIHLHHLIDFPPNTAAVLLAACRRLNIHLRVAVHDYYAICPRVNLVTLDGHYCGEPEPAACDRCLARDDLAATTGSIVTWRARSMKLLAQANQIVVPSADVARRMTRHAPALGPAIEVEPHDDIEPGRLLPRPAPAGGGPLKVLTVGAISRIKGFDVLRRLAESSRELQLPLEFALLGYSMDDIRLSQVGVSMLGRYFDNEMAERIAAYDPDVILIPSIWPETYCYVLSGAIGSGRPVAVFDIGAQADRARENGDHHIILPLALEDDGAALARAIIDGARGPKFEARRQAA